MKTPEYMYEKYPLLKAIGLEAEIDHFEQVFWKTANSNCSQCYDEEEIEWVIKATLSHLIGFYEGPTVTFLELWDHILKIYQLEHHN